MEESSEVYLFIYLRYIVHHRISGVNVEKRYSIEEVEEQRFVDC